jgi:hypothetical protein
LHQDPSDARRTRDGHGHTRQEARDVIARTTVGRSLAVMLAVAVSQVTAPMAQALTPHLVAPQQVDARLAEQAAQRTQQVKVVQDLLDSPQAREQAGVLGLNVGKLRAAVPHLSDAELKDLSARAARTKDLAAGHYDESMMIVGLVLLLAGLAVLIAVSHDGYYDDCYCY